MIGSLKAPSLVVITEGQWDAVSFAYACGWMEESCANPPPVFGLRGASSTEVFLSYYARWISVHKPTILIIGDNDPAGMKLAQRADTNNIHEPFSFVDRLEAHGASRVIFQTINKRYGKDFNDFYKAVHPTPAFMADWLSAMKLEI